MSRSQMRYHPRIGYTYMPNARMRVQGANGGYLVRTNAAGFRSDSEFVLPGKAGTFRALLFGDSQAAGDHCANAERYSDVLEKAVPGLEVYNYGLSGTGTDQQFLAYQENKNDEHDQLIIGLIVEYIRRVNCRLIKSLEDNGDAAYYAKPYYQLENDELVLRNVPVPKRPWTEQTLPAEHLAHVYSHGATRFTSAEDWAGIRSIVPTAPLRKAMKSLVMRVSRFQPLPEYDTPDTSEWLLLRGILETWFQASNAPVLLVPIPHRLYFDAPGSSAAYQARFRELAESTGCYLYDPFPDLCKFTAEERRSFWLSGHLSPHGHKTIAALLAPAIERIMREC